MTGSFDRPVLCPIIVGRTSDLATIRALLEQAKRGSGQIALLSGEAGIGKSRLIAEIRALAANLGFLHIQGNCFPTDPSCPYAPLLDLFHTSFATLPAVEVAEQVEPYAREILPLLPESGQFLSTLTKLPPLPSLEPEQEKRRLFAALAHIFLRKMTEQHPLLLIIEDLHWCDDLSLEFLHYLGRHCAVRPVLVLLTYRDDEVRPALKSWLAQIDRARIAQEFPLARLPHDGVDAMLQAICKLPHALHKELLDSIYTLTEGNPFFVEETLKSLITSGDLSYNEGVWESRAGSQIRVPRSIQDTVQRRSALLSESARQVLLLASVAGHRFDFTLLQELTRHDEHQLLTSIKELIAAQLVVEESAERFAFRHALTRQATYGELLLRERRQMHRQIAETLERLYTPLPESYLADLSAHFYEAELWEKAFVYARRAGEYAQILHAPEAAIQHFSRALESARRLNMPPPPRLYRERGQAYETLGKFEQARCDYEQSKELARAAHDQRAEWQSLVDLGFLWTERDYARGAEYYQQAMSLARQVDDAILIAYSLNRVGNWHLNREEPHAAVRYHQEALAVFREINHRDGIAETLDLLGMASYLGGNLQQSSEYYEQARVYFEQSGDYKGLASLMGTLILCGGSYQAETLVPVAMSTTKIAQDGERALKLAREVGHRSGEAYILMNLGFCLGLRGAYGQTLKYLHIGLALAEEIEHRQWLAGTHCALGALYRDLLLLDEARQALERAVELSGKIGSQFWLTLSSALLAAVVVESGDLPGAERVLNAVLTTETPARSVAQRLAWCIRVQLALARHDARLALEICDRLIDTAPDVKHEAPRLLLLRSKALLALKQNIEAETVLQAAQEIAHEQEQRPLLWRIHLLSGRLLSDTRRHEEAQRTFLAAHELVEELATSLTDEVLRARFTSRADALLVPARPLSSRRAEKIAFEGLTAREREIATLVAQGKYNREIADQLVLSERTVETHVSNIMFKLNFTSRRQIALWAVKKGLVADL